MLQTLGKILLNLADGTLFPRVLWHGTAVLTESRMDDPVYKKNVQGPIERNRSFEEAKE